MIFSFGYRLRHFQRFGPEPPGLVRADIPLLPVCIGHIVGFAKLQTA
jgi:hypothetical protein